MRGALSISILLMTLNVISQNLVKGTVYDFTGETIPGVKIIENKTNNKIQSDLDGRFQLKTLNDSCSLTIYQVGFEPQLVVITSDTVLNITLDNDHYNTRWLSIGSSYGVINNVLGLQLSNGVDEEPLIHFEDFQDNILIKVHGQTDFDDNHAYGAEFGINSLRYIGRTTLKFDEINFDQSSLFLTDLNLTSRIRYFGNTGVVFRSGYQNLNDSENFGIGIGLEQSVKSFYIGFNSRYYFDYFHHEAYLQIEIPTKNVFSFRSVFNRVENFNLLTFGLNYAFVRNAN